MAQRAAVLLAAKARLVVTINTKLKYHFFSLFISLTPFAAELKCSRLPFEDAVVRWLRTSGAEKFSKCLYHGGFAQSSSSY